MTEKNIKINPQYLVNWEETLKALQAPFAPEEIEFLPQVIDYKNGTAVAAAYADSRVYTSRLNEVIGAGFWQSEIKTVSVTEYNKIIKAKLDYKTKLETAPATETKGFKVYIVARVGIYMGSDFGWVWHESTGAKETDDENSITTAEAQAYKRAISKWGPGNYLYTLGTNSYAYDTKSRKWLTNPTLPDWAIPAIKCTDCGEPIKGITVELDSGTVVKTKQDIAIMTKEVYGKALCVDCHKIIKAQQSDPNVSKRLNK